MFYCCFIDQMTKKRCMKIIRGVENNDIVFLKIWI